MRRILFSVLTLTLTACSMSVKVSPKNSQLSDAQVGKQYFSRIEITGGRVTENGIPGEITPKDNGLYLKSCEPLSVTKNNCIQITGIPEKQAPSELRWQGAFMALCSSANRFDKTYTINVLDH
jgi:hypothetical protein